MNSRLQALIDRGYDKELVLQLSNYTEEDIEYATNEAFKHISRNCKPVSKPASVFIGGQPGCGKTILSYEINEYNKNTLVIGIDNYRMYHPNYLKIEECIKEHWKNKQETINDSPGNDMADFTHWFAGDMTDRLIEKGKNQSYNMILEWGMRTSEAPLKTMHELKEKGYKNTVIFVATHKDISYEACQIRAKNSNNNHIVRKVPKYFHDLSISTLPDSINTIYNDGISKNIIDDMVILNRKNEVIWNTKSKQLPGEVYDKVLNNIIYSKDIKNHSDMSLKTNNDELIGLHTLKENLQNIKNMYIIQPELLETSSKFYR